MGSTTDPWPEPRRVPGDDAMACEGLVDFVERDAELRAHGQGNWKGGSRMLRWVVVTLILAAAFLESGMRAGAVTGAEAFQVMPTATPVPQSSRPTGINPGVLPGRQAQTSTGTGPVRLPGQDCRGLASCAWRGQSEFTGTCTADARVCMSTGSDPAGTVRICSGQGGMRVCTDAGGLIPNGSPAGPNIYPGGTTSISPSGTSTDPGVNR
jgi:hypothetical protein